MEIDILAGFVTDFTTENRLHRQAKSLLKHFYVHVVGFYDPKNPPALSHWDGLSVSHVRVSRTRLPGFLFFLVFMVKMFFCALRYRPKIFYACDVPVLFPFFLASLFRPGILIYDSREIFTELPDVYRKPLKRNLWKLLEWLSVRRVKQSMVVCEADKSALQAKYPVLKPAVIRNLPVYMPYRASNFLRDRLQVDLDTPVILFQGTLLKSGGVVQLVRSAEFITRGHVVILGDGPERKAVLKAAEHKNVKSKITWMPPVPFNRLHEVICSADIGTYLGMDDGISFRNALPNKIFEYARGGLPMIVTDLPEIRKINDRYDIGILLHEVEPRAIAGAVNRLIDDLELQKTLRKNSLAMAREMCWEKEEGKFLELFKFNPPDYSPD